MRNPLKSLRRLPAACVRALPAVLAGAIAVVLVGQILRPNFQTAGVLFDPPMATGWACAAQLLLIVALLVDPRRSRRAVTGLAAGAVLAFFLATAAVDSVSYYALWAGGSIAPRRMLPLSLVLAAILTIQLARWARRRPQERPSAVPMRRRFVQTAALLGLGAFALPLAEQAFFGSTAYQHRAEVAVVFGAGVHADGSASDALRDRVLTAADLHRAGRVDVLLMTGGIDPNHGRSEPEVMRRLAIDAGVPADAIVLDEGGDNTLASVRNASVICRRHGYGSAVMVSHDYHLPRIKRLADRDGLRCWTVPARERWPLSKGPYFRLREAAAWHYYLLALPGR